MPTITPGKSIRQVAEIIHASVVLGAAGWGRESMPEAHMSADIEDKLKREITEFFAILHARNIPYVLVGGIAMLAYIEGRNTKDVDIVLSVDSLSRLPEVIISDQNREFARGKFGELLIDFLFTENPLFNLVEKKHSAVHRFLETDVRSATVEGLILLKMFALPSLYLEGNLEKSLRYEADIAILYQLSRPDVDPLYAELKPLITEGQLVDLRTIMQEIKQRIARLDRAKKPQA